MFSIKITKKQKTFSKLFNSIKLKDNFMNEDFYSMLQGKKQEIDVLSMII